MRFTYGLIQFKSHKIYSHIEERLSVYIPFYSDMFSLKKDR